MDKKEVLKTLVKIYHNHCQTSRWNRLNGYEEMANQSIHQAFGVKESAIALGISEDDFDEAYKAYRKLKRIENRQA